jgi:hypothetical protein
MMRNLLLSVMAVAMTVWSAGSVHAQTPAYSFELPLPAGPDGFFGLGATVTQEPTIGVTHLENSMKYDVGPAGFVGARTETVIPPALNDPPGVSHVLFDITIIDAYAGAFADLGVTVFGHALNAPGGPEFGHQVQFADTISLATLALGTHLDQRIDLDLSVGPYRFGESFNDIFGLGPNDLTLASAFQFFISKNAGVPITVYLDNVRLVVPEPATVLMSCLGAIVVGASRRRRK